MGVDAGDGEQDIVERLRWSGQDAMTKHLSLGMAKLHAEAADEIERLRKERDEARRREREWHNASVTAREELHSLLNMRGELL